ncbi:hypothetical protein ACTMU2_07775 [Cupriavidus basilensis]
MMRAGGWTDADRFPAHTTRGDSPAAAAPSIILWTFLPQRIIVTLGAGLTVILWPKGTPSDTLWFWCCAAAYPDLRLDDPSVCCALGISYVKRSEAMAHQPRQ